jgi:hypothetical protein
MVSSLSLAHGRLEKSVIINSEVTSESTRCRIHLGDSFLRSAMATSRKLQLLPWLHASFIRFTTTMIDSLEV